MFLFAGLQLGYAGIDTRILRLFSVNTQKNPYLNQATTKQKNSCQILLSPQKSRNQKAQVQKHPSNRPQAA